jgi:nicotinamidase-related amidase
VLVDLYRNVFGDQPEPLLESVKKWPASCGMAGWSALPKIQALLAEAREAGIAVVHVTALEGFPHWRSPMGAPAGGGSGGHAGTNGASAPGRFAIMPEVTPAPGEPLLTKAAPSAFWGTPLAAYLNQMRIDTVIVVGESTSGCVRATVVDGCSYRYRMLVVEDCVFDRHQAAHAINLFDMDQKYADVISLDEAVGYLRSLTPAGQRVEAL